MKRFLKTAKHVIPVLLLSTSLSLGILGDFISLLSWGDGMCQTLDEDDIPIKRPITPND
ncbi:MAG: hypothetical protein K2P87_12740 [Lachnospiraceae bacterium]|nr:hypothetical protein [Lachnospiraceae bacterium]